MTALNEGQTWLRFNHRDTETASFAALAAAIGGVPAVLTYQDDEQDTISVSCSNELAEALRVARSDGRTTLTMKAELRDGRVANISVDMGDAASPPVDVHVLHPNIKCTSNVQPGYRIVGA